MKLVALSVAISVLFGVPWLTGICVGLTSSTAAQIGASAVLSGLIVYLSIKPANRANGKLIIERELLNRRGPPSVR